MYIYIHTCGIANEIDRKILYMLSVSNHNTKPWYQTDHAFLFIDTDSPIYIYTYIYIYIYKFYCIYKSDEHDQVRVCQIVQSLNIYIYTYI